MEWWRWDGGAPTRLADAAGAAAAKGYVMMWGYGYQIGWMWLWGVFLLVGIAVLVILAIRLLTGGLGHEGPGLLHGTGQYGTGQHGTGQHGTGQYPPPGQDAAPGHLPPPPPLHPPGRSQARLILDERFARGELTVEEYRENLKVLGEES